MRKSSVMLDRLKNSVGSKSGCSVLYLKIIKSDLARVLGQYMCFEDLEINVVKSQRAERDSYEMKITLNASEFFELGRSSD